MVWFKVCDTLWGHDKVEEAGLEAMGLWVLAGSRCGQQLSDGFVSHQAVVKCMGTPKLAQRLVKAGLWVEVEGGYLFHDWADNNPLKADIESRREADRERKRSVRSDSARGPQGFPVGSGRVSKSKSSLPGFRPDSTRTPPRIGDLCGPHALDRTTCPHCRSEAREAS